jgi:hypothetical protein
VLVEKSPENLFGGLHLDSNAADRVRCGIENPSEWLQRHIYDQTSLTVPRLNRLDDIPVWRQLGAVWSKIVNRSLDLIEHEDRRPTMMMDRFFVVWLQRYLKNTQPVVLEKDFMVLRRCDYGIPCRIPGRWMQIRTIIQSCYLVIELNRSVP